jgi:hypothetical protein
MLHAGRLNGRLFCLALYSFAALALTLGVTQARAQTPALTTISEVHYRGNTRAMARVTNPASIAQQQSGIDDGVRSLVRHVKSPTARTSADCENGALAV